MDKGRLREAARQQRKDQILLLRVASTGSLDITSQVSPSYKNRSPHLNENLRSSFLGGGVYSNSANSKLSLRSPIKSVEFQPHDELAHVREHWSKSNYDSSLGGQFQQLLNEREHQLSQPRQNSSGSNPTIKRPNILHREISLFHHQSPFIDSPPKNAMAVLNYGTSSNKLTQKIKLQSYLSNEVSEYNQVERPNNTIKQKINIKSGLSQENKISSDQEHLISQISQHLQQIKSLEDEILKQKFLAKDSLDQFIKIERSYAELEQELWALKIQQLGKNGVKNIEEQQQIKIEQLEQQIQSNNNQFKSLESNELKLKQRIVQLEQQKKSYKHCLNCSGEKTDPRIVNYAERIIELEKLNDQHNNRLSIEVSVVDQLRAQCSDLKLQIQNLNQRNQVLQNELESLESTQKSQYQLRIFKLEEEILNKNKQVDQLLMKLRNEENRNKNFNELNSQNQLQIISELNQKVYDLNEHIVNITKSFERETEINSRTNQEDLQTWKKNFINLNVQFHQLQEKHVMLEAELENKIKQDQLNKKKQNNLFYSFNFNSADRRGSLSSSYIFSQTEELAISKQFRGSIQEESVQEDYQTSESIQLKRLPEGAILPGTEKRSLRSVMQKVIKKTEQPSVASVVQEVIRQKHLAQVPSTAQVPTQPNASIITNQRKSINSPGSESSQTMQSQRMN